MIMVKDANVITNDPSKTIVVVGEGCVPEDKIREFKDKTGASVIGCPLKNQKINLVDVLSALGKRNIMYLLVEGGARVVGSFIEERLVDKFYIFKAPRLIGGDDAIPMAYGGGVDKMDDAITIEQIKIRRFKDDLLIEGYPVFN